VILGLEAATTRSDTESKKERHAAHKSDVFSVFFSVGLFIERLILIVCINTMLSHSASSF